MSIQDIHSGVDLANKIFKYCDRYKLDQEGPSLVLRVGPLV